MVETIPQSKQEITVEYLNTVLKEKVLNGKNKIVSIKDGESIPPSFKSEVFRILSSYEQADAQLPSSFIIKLATSNPGINSLLQNIQGYYKEVHFYPQLARLTDLKTPTIYYSAVNDTKNQFIIIMEDLVPKGFNVASQDTAIDTQFALAIIKYFALIQSKFWNNPGQSAFQSIEWLKEPNFALYLKDLTIKMFEERKHAFIERNQSRLTEKTITTLQTINIQDLYQQNFPSDLKHCTLVHGDPQPTNLYVNEAKDEILMADWQYSSVGYGVKDVILLLGIWLSPDTTREDIAHLKDVYYQQLLQHGVQSFTREDFETQWRQCLLLSLCNIASVSEKENIGEDLEKQRQYKEYLTVSETRFLNFLQNQDY